MRVIAGEKRGMLLKSPDTGNIRPTHDRVREAVFGSLQFTLSGSRVLDLFAGSGAMGVEALSRGAAYAVFVDNSGEAAAAIRANVQKAGYAAKSAIFKNDYEIALKLFNFDWKFDIVFIDPPYTAGLYQKALASLHGSSVLAPGAVLILESGEPLAADAERFARTREKKYGKAYITHLEYKA